MNTLIEISTALRNGIYCAEDGSGTDRIYAVGTDVGSTIAKLFVIGPE